MHSPSSLQFRLRAMRYRVISSRGDGLEEYRQTWQFEDKTRSYDAVHINTATFV